MTKIALIGNPNCGKTTLFNLLTGARQRVGNRTGVTTEKKEGTYGKDKSVKFIDLPGLYSITASAKDEQAVLNYLSTTPPDVIINIVDGTNLERNLFLTTELLELGVPTVIAVNMADDLEKNGVVFNATALSNDLGVKVLPISALKNKNVVELVNLATAEKAKPKPLDFSPFNGDYTTKRYEFISNVIKKCIKPKQTRAQRFTLKADDILTHKFFGLPIFFASITAVYFISFKLGGLLSGLISNFFDIYSVNAKNALLNINAPKWFSGLVGVIITGTGSVVEFLPQILTLFLLLAILEESGYTSRVAFNLDRIFRAFGLGGKSAIPLILSCGCTVSGIMATRSMENESERKATIMLTPFMPCGAKFAVFGWFSYEFFGGSALIASSLFFVGVLSVCVFGKLLKVGLKKKDDSGFILELPTYRLPSFKSVFFVLWEKLKEFLVKAGTIMLAVSVLLWFFTNFGFKGFTDGKVENSFMYLIGNALKYFFYPLGFGNWESATAVLSGILAKEAVVESLEVLCTEVDYLFYNNFSVYAFLTFVLLSPPCIASVLQAKRELKSKKDLAFMLIFQTLSAYAVALIINLLGFIYYLFPRLIFIFITVIIIALGIFAIKKLLNVKKCVGTCGGCSKCLKK